MKVTIDTQSQISSLTQQQKIAAGSLMDIYDKRSIGYPADVISSILIRQVVLKKRIFKTTCRIHSEIYYYYVNILWKNKKL